MTTTTSVGTAAFTASGLATGMDTNSIIDSLVSVESQPITDIRTKQSNITVQVSALSDIINSLKALDTAATNLSTNGVYSAKTASTNTAFTATPGSSSTAGRYSVEVQQLATAASWRSDGLASTDSLAAGKLTLSVGGKSYPPADATTGIQTPISISQGDSLVDVAYKIRASGAPVSAVALTDSSGKSYLSITSLNTGAPLDGSTDLALTFTRDAAATGNDLDFGTPTVKHALNATVLVDGLSFTRTSNAVTDVIPGVTLNLAKQAPGAPEDLLISTDPTGTQARLQTFVTAYNAVMTLVQRQLNVTKDTDRNKTLAGDGAVRDVQTKLQNLIVTKVPGLSSVRSLADLGLKTARDGSLSIDSDTLTRALATDPAAVNAMFSTQSTGLSAVIDKMVQSETAPTTGLLVADQDGLNKTSAALDDQAATIQLRVDSYRQMLVSQFTAMETTVSGLKSMGSYLTSAFSSMSIK
jgi:flagellar hook-associated protein 2